MKVLISGGTGFIGSALVTRLLAQGDQVTVISRKSKQQMLSSSFVSNVDWLQWPLEGEMFELAPHDVVINLAGEGIADKRWTERRKQLLWDSRVQFTQLLIDCIEQQSWKPSVWLNASAIGYYGAGTELVNEASQSGDDFAAKLCVAWEAQSAKIIEWSCRLVIMRFGVVLGHGGMLKKLKPSFVMAMGATLGDGHQGLSWIHLDDLTRAVLFLMKSDRLNGIFNLTAPQPVSNRVFTQSYASSLNRPAWMVMPASLMKWMLGEMAETLLLSGQYVLPENLDLAGFTFNYPDINTALSELMG